MKTDNLKFYRCPISGDQLELEKSSTIADGKVTEGTLLSKKINKKYLNVMLGKKNIRYKL